MVFARSACMVLHLASPAVWRKNQRWLSVAALASSLFDALHANTIVRRKIAMIEASMPQCSKLDRAFPMYRTQYDHWKGIRWRED